MAEDHSIILDENMLQRFIQRAKLAAEQGNWLHAASLLTEAMTIDPGNGDLGQELFYIAQFCSAPDSDDLRHLLLNIVRLLYDGESVISYDFTLFYAGNILIGIGEAERGEMLLREAIKLNDDDYFNLTLGYHLLNCERYDEGIDILNSLVYEMEDEELKSIIEAITWAYFKRNRKEDAIRYLLDQFEYWPIDIIFDIYLRTTRLLEDGDAIQSLNGVINKLTSLDEEGEGIKNIEIYHSKALSELGYRYQKSGRDVEALIPIFQSIQHDPDNLVAIRSFGKMLLQFSRPEQALEYADRAVALASDDPRNYAFRAEVLVALKDYQEALASAETGLEHFQKTIQEIRENKSSYGVFRIGAPDLGEFEGEKKVEEEPDPQSILLLRKADALIGLERFDEALKTLELAEKLFPRELIFYRYVATLLLKLERPKLADTHIKAASSAGLKLDKPSLQLKKRIRKALADTS